MDMELDALETRIEQIVSLLEQLRAENEVLRNRIATADAERIQLRQTMQAARERLENLMGRLPEGVWDGH